MLEPREYPFTRAQWVLAVVALALRRFCPQVLLLTAAFLVSLALEFLLSSSAEVRGSCSDAEMTCESVDSAYAHHFLSLGRF